MKKDIEKVSGSNKLAIFEGAEIRRISVDGEWYYSVVDVIKALTDSDNPRNYWSMLKSRESQNGIELSTICVQLKLQSSDGKSKVRSIPISLTPFHLLLNQLLLPIGSGKKTCFRIT